MSIGPKITIRRSCADCAVCQGERYTCQSDSGTDVYCAHPSFPQRRIIGDSRWDTPQWCPAEPEIAASADARITEIERECSQWRDELRIYRETENKRIAELEAEVARLRDALDQSALEYADLAVSAKSLEEHLSALVEVSEKSTIALARAALNGDDEEGEDEDAARAGNGGG